MSRARLNTYCRRFMKGLTVIIQGEGTSSESYVGEVTRGLDRHRDQDSVGPKSPNTPMDCSHRLNVPEWEPKSECLTSSSPNGGGEVRRYGLRAMKEWKARNELMRQQLQPLQDDGHRKGGGNWNGRGVSDIVAWNMELASLSSLFCLAIHTSLPHLLESDLSIRGFSPDHSDALWHMLILSRTQLQREHTTGSIQQEEA